ncbi:Flp family type IVb pilin [Fangia hongkongensis]|uniref:Flp family type IVb pilin n=1 Tax=Fangia hongkongensis TaxID=270495 RepID=UPI00037F5501|nr:Flp family type IVb pilin [Fangia hongkongensis]
MLLNLYCKAAAAFMSFKNDQRGVTAIEYGLIAIAMAILIITYFSFSGSSSIVKQLNDGFSKVTSNLASWNSGP